MVNRMHPNFRRAIRGKKQLDEVNIMNVINDNTFNLHNSLLNNDNRYMKVILKSKLLGVAR